MKKLLLSILSIVLFNNSAAWAQCSMYELPLEQKVQNSSNIIEGKVTEQYSFWDNKHSFIYTSNVIQVLKEFKGQLNKITIEVISEGGVVGDQMQTVEPNVHLNIGDIGIFILQPSSVKDPNGTGEPTFLCYGDAQGFIQYDLISKTAITPFKKYADVKNELYSTLIALVGNHFSSLQNFDIEKLPAINLPIVKTGGITNFTPTSITGGTYSVLTINGSGFGATRGSSEVKFKDPDNGGSSYKRAEAGHYVSWSDTQIKLKVPAKAGTGTIQVVVGSNTYTSTGTLTIPYTETNTTDTVKLPSYTTLAKIDPVTEGIVWRMNTSFDANPNAKNSFSRAMQTWMDATCVNWSLGTPTDVNVRVYDSVSVVRYDIANELSAGTLARCYYYWVKCTDTLWVVAELDMVIDGSTSWWYETSNPSGSEYDFESVMLHELGHGHQLNHVINASDVMHYSIIAGSVKRTLNPSNTAGGLDVMSRSTTHTTCSFFDPMTASTSCLIGVTDLEIGSNLHVYPNPNSGKTTVMLKDGNNIKHVEIYNQFGMLVKVCSNVNDQQTQIDLTHLASGIYNLLVHDGSGVSKQTIVIN